MTTGAGRDTDEEADGHKRLFRPLHLPKALYPPSHLFTSPKLSVGFPGSPLGNVYFEYVGSEIFQE